MNFLRLLYGVLCYLIFLATFVYAIGFVSNVGVPKSMDVGLMSPFWQAVLINLLLLGVFAVQHSVMARQGFKRWWTRIIPASIERSTYVLLSSLALLLLFWQWRPMGPVLWDVSGSMTGQILIGVSLAGWAMVLISTFLLDHFELFGLKQVTAAFRGSPVAESRLRTPLFYRWVRHPIYVGFILAFWATPVMTAAHLLFAVATLGYTIIGVWFEERDLVAHFGEDYRRYQSKVGMLFPRLFGRRDR